MTTCDGDGNTYRRRGVINEKYFSNWRGGARDTEPDRDVYGGGSGPGVTNIGGSDGGAWLMVAEGVALHETCAGGHR